MYTKPEFNIRQFEAMCFAATAHFGKVVGMVNPYREEAELPHTMFVSDNKTPRVGFPNLPFPAIGNERRMNNEDLNPSLYNWLEGHAKEYGFEVVGGYIAAVIVAPINGEH